MGDGSDTPQTAGYDRGYGRVRAYVKTLRQPMEAAVVRFEPSPGHQGQVDFGTLRTPWGSRQGAAQGDGPLGCSIRRDLHPDGVIASERRSAPCNGAL